MSDLSNLLEENCKDKNLNFPSRLSYILYHDPSIDTPFNASINTNNWLIDIKIKEKNVFSQEQLCFIVYTLLLHEEGHWKICPFDTQYHLQIRASVIKAYHEVFKNKQEEFKVPLCSLLVNLFEDMVVDWIISNKDPNYKEGNQIILNTSDNTNQNNYGIKNLGKLIICIYKSFLLDEKIQECQQVKCTKKIINQIDKERIHNREFWPEYVGKFAKAFFKCIEKMGFLISKDTNAMKMSIEMIKDTLTSVSIQERRLKEHQGFREKNIKEYFSYFDNDITNIYEKIPIEDYREAIDLYFQSKAEKIVIHSMNKQSVYPITIGSRKLREDEIINPAMIRWKATKIYEKNGETVIDLEKKIHFNKKKVNKEGQSIPDIAFIIDSSISMGNIKNVNSSYHILVLAIYSVLNYLNCVDKLRYMKFCVINFSDKTLYSGWKEYTSLTKLKYDFILLQQLGKTVLNPWPIKQMLKDSKDKFLAIMITDGEIENCDQVVESIKELTLKGNNFSLIQIGNANEFVKQVKPYANDLYVITDASQLTGLMLGMAKEKW